MIDRVREILSWYASDNPGTLANLYRMLNHGRLAGTGTIMGRNSFQRSHDEAVELLHQVMDIHASTWPAK